MNVGKGKGGRTGRQPGGTSSATGPSVKPSKAPPERKKAVNSGLTRVPSPSPKPDSRGRAPQSCDATHPVPGFVISNRELVLLVLYRLGGATRAVHTEDIAHEVFQIPMGRQRYRWHRFEQYPDKERIARELRRMKTSHGQPLVRGNVNVGARLDRRDGWALTPAGVDVARQVEKAKGSALSLPAPVAFATDVANLRKQIMSSKCYGAYLKDQSLGSAKDYMFTDMLQCLPDASSELIRESFDSLLARVKAAESDDVVEFLRHAEIRFSNLLGR